MSTSTLKKGATYTYYVRRSRHLKGKRRIKVLAIIAAGRGNTIRYEFKDEPGTEIHEAEMRLLPKLTPSAS